METPTPFLLLLRPPPPRSPRFVPLDRDRGVVVVCFDFRLHSMFVIVLIHQGNAKGEHRHAAGRAGKRTFELKSHRLTRVMPRDSVSAGRMRLPVHVALGPAITPRRLSFRRIARLQAKSSTSSRSARPDRRLTPHVAPRLARTDSSTS